jgi:hypothetical protein
VTPRETPPSDSAFSGKRLEDVWNPWASNAAGAVRMAIEITAGRNLTECLLQTWMLKISPGLSLWKIVGLC